MGSLYSTCMLFLFCLNLYLSPSSCLSIAVCYKIQKYFWDFDNVQLFFSLVSIEGWWVWADMQYSHKISFHKTPLWDTWLFWTFWGLQNTVEYHFHFQFIFTFLSRQKPEFAKGSYHHSGKLGQVSIIPLFSPISKKNNIFLWLSH